MCDAYVLNGAGSNSLERINGGNVSSRYHLRCLIGTNHFLVPTARYIIILLIEGINSHLYLCRNQRGLAILPSHLHCIRPTFRHCCATLARKPEISLRREKANAERCEG